MTDAEPMLRARPYYEPEFHTLAVELLRDGEVFAVIGLGEATALGAELVRMAAYAENECQLDLAYELMGRDLPTRRALLALQKTARRVYFGELTGEIEIGGVPGEEELSSEQEGNDARREA